MRSEYRKIQTLQNSGCRCPIVGKAIAFRILSGTLVGPGPIMVFSGMTKGDDKILGASMVNVDILKREILEKNPAAMM